LVACGGSRVQFLAIDRDMKPVVRRQLSAACTPARDAVPDGTLLAIFAGGEVEGAYLPKN